MKTLLRNLETAIDRSIGRRNLGMGLLALISVAIAIMGPDWTADLFKRKEPSP